MERIPADTWDAYSGHVARYRWAASLVNPGESVNDIACGVGYGAVFLAARGPYRGYDKPGVPDARFPGRFAEVDLNDPGWVPETADCTTSFETLEHVKDPARVASVIAAATRRAVFVSVPIIPTVHCNPWHCTDFTRDDIPPLFPDFVIGEEWAQPEETSHVWMFVRA